MKRGFTMIRTSLRNNLVIAKQGFTMIELLVVISIIGVLTTLVFTSFTSSQKQARDAQRKSDIKQYQTTLESFANKTNGLYPSRTSATDIAGLCATLGISGTCPTDPKAPASIYSVITNGTGSPNEDASEYILWTTLESQSGYFWIVCSTGKTDTAQSAPTSSSCPI